MNVDYKLITNYRLLFRFNGRMYASDTTIF